MAKATNKDRQNVAQLLKSVERLAAFLDSHKSEDPKTQKVFDDVAATAAKIRAKVAKLTG